MGWPSLNGCFTCNLIKRVHESHYPLRDKSSRAKYICAHVRTHDHQRVVRGRSCQRRTRDPLAGERAVSGTPCPSQKRQKPVLRWITGCVSVIQNLPWRAPGADSVGSLWMLRTQEGKTTFLQLRTTMWRKSTELGRGRGHCQEPRKSFHEPKK